MKKKSPERRRFVRIKTPLKVVIRCGDRTDESVTKDISPVGLSFETGRAFNTSESLSMSLGIPERQDLVRFEGRVAWQTKTSLEDNAPYNVGVEITDVNDEDKTDFLKYLCDLMYQSKQDIRTEAT